MNAKLKSFLIVVAKIAVNALLTSAAFTQIMGGTFSIHTSDGWWNLLKGALIIIGSRELITWAPIVLKWSNTDATPNDLEASLDKAQEASQQAVDATKQAKSAIEEAKAVAPTNPAPKE